MAIWRLFVPHAPSYTYLVSRSRFLVSPSIFSAVVNFDLFSRNANRQTKLKTRSCTPETMSPSNRWIAVFGIKCIDLLSIFRWNGGMKYKLSVKYFYFPHKFEICFVCRFPQRNAKHIETIEMLCLFVEVRTGTSCSLIFTYRATNIPIHILFWNAWDCVQRHPSFVYSVHSFCNAFDK